MSLDVLRQKLPEVESWVERTLAAHVAQAHPVVSFGFKRLGDYYAPSLLHTAKVVSLPVLPIPPLSRMGLSGFEEFEQLDAAGITYRDTYFVRREFFHDESLHFHELVHVIQWLHLGPANFILAYALGHRLSGYRNNPMERMAYALQARFESGEPAFDAAAIVCPAADRDFHALMCQAGLD